MFQKCKCPIILIRTTVSIYEGGKKKSLNNACSGNSIINGYVKWMTLIIKDGKTGLTVKQI